MREVNLSERLALAKLAEHLLALGKFEPEDLAWLSVTFGFSEFNDGESRLFSILSSCYSKRKIERLYMFAFLDHVYEQYAEAFPNLMEEMLRKTFLDIFRELKHEPPGQGKKEAWNLAKNTFERHLEVLGYELTVDLHAKTFDVVDIRVVEREMSEDRRAERNKLLSLLDARFKDEYTAMNGAYERYMEGGTDASRQAIDSCRNAFENLFKKITGKGNWREGLKEIIKSETLSNLVSSVYSFLSSYGAHSPKVREKEDAFLAIRLTEDLMIRLFQETGMW